MNGYTTGTCATAASFLAATRLLGHPHRERVPVTLPDDSAIEIPIVDSGVQDTYAWASVRKFSGNDPDITHNTIVRAQVSRSKIPGVEFLAGSGVGTVTRPGLQIAPGNAAINPVPRQMIANHLLALGSGWTVTISVENGEELAQNTFNPRLGILGGISIIGTTGIVRPFSHESQLCSIRCAIGVAQAANLHRLILVPGHYGERSARMHYPCVKDPGIIEVGNDWGFALKFIQEQGLQRILVVGHAGKLAKLATDQWDTHSSRSCSALPWILQEWENATGTQPENMDTVEGFSQQIANKIHTIAFWHGISEKIAESIRTRFPSLSVSVALCDMKGKIIAESAGVEQWK